MSSRIGIDRSYTNRSIEAHEKLPEIYNQVITYGIRPNPHIDKPDLSYWLCNRHTCCKFSGDQLYIVCCVCRHWFSNTSIRHKLSCEQRLHLEQYSAEHGFKRIQGARFALRIF